MIARTGAGPTSWLDGYGHRVPYPIDIPSDQFVTLDGIRFHYPDWGGDGDPLLLLAGLGCTAHVFAVLAPHLTERFRVLALTRRGHGLTDQVQSGHALADAAEDARRLLDDLGIERAHVVGTRWEGVRSQPSPLAIPDASPASSTSTGPYDWVDSPTPEGSEAGAGPDRFASYKDYVAFVRSVLPDDIWGPALDTMLRTCVDTHADRSVVDKLSAAAFAPFVQALNTFRHPYSDMTAPALAIYAVGDRWQGADATWRAASVTASPRRRRMVRS